MTKVTHSACMTVQYILKSYSWRKLWKLGLITSWTSSVVKTKLIQHLSVCFSNMQASTSKWEYIFQNSNEIVCFDIQFYIRYKLLPSVFLFLRWRGNKCRCLIFNSPQLICAFTTLQWILVTVAIQPIMFRKESPIHLPLSWISRFTTSHLPQTEGGILTGSYWASRSIYPGVTETHISLLSVLNLPAAQTHFSAASSRFKWGKRNE